MEKEKFKIEYLKENIEWLVDGFKIIIIFNSMIFLVNLLLILVKDYKLVFANILIQLLVFIFSVVAIIGGKDICKTLNKNKKYLNLKNIKRRYKNGKSKRRIEIFNAKRK
jgi:hypothetical protein